jgi:hypothetical protein
MDKTLDSIQSIHRLLMILTVALAVVGLSAEKPTNLYQSAQKELSTLQDAIRSADDSRDQTKSAIFEHSSLKELLSAWIQSRRLTTKDFTFNIIEPDDLLVPDYDLNPNVTVGEQVRWADRIYNGLDSPFYMCAVTKKDFFGVLNKTFKDRALPEFLSFTLNMKKTVKTFRVKHKSRCILSIAYSSDNGNLVTSESVTLEIPGRLESVVGVKDTDDYYDSPEDILKGKGLGDYEDAREIWVPSIRALWSELSNKVPPSAESYLKQMAHDEQERRKTHIDLLGQPVSATMALIGGPLVLLFLLIVLMAHIIHVKNIMDGHERAIKEFPFFGLMWSKLGIALAIFSVILFPVSVCYLCLIVVVNSMNLAIGRDWMSFGRWGILVAVCAVGVMSFIVLFRIVSAVRERDNQT